MLEYPGDDVRNLCVGLGVHGVSPHPGAGLTHLVHNLAHIGIQFVDGETRSSLKVSGVLNLDGPLVTCGKLQVIETFLPVFGVGLVGKFEKVYRFLYAGVRRDSTRNVYFCHVLAHP